MLKLLLPTAIFLMMVSIGTSFRALEMWNNTRRMGGWKWLRLLLAVFIIPPALALGLARIMPLSLAETSGLFLIGVAPGAPLLTRNVAKRGFDAQLAAVYQVWVALLTPIMIPLLVFGAAKLYDRDVWIPPSILLKQVAEKQFFPLIVGLSLIFGILLIIPIGGADMPTVISLLNGYAGLSAAAMGFVLKNKLLIIAGALDGSSGLILSVIMSKAMNRSFTNVLFGAFGQVQAAATGGAEAKPVHGATAEEAAAILAAANKVVIVPGYGMAVAQAQHKVRELYDILSKKGVEVRFAIHPVAGRMPGHMNVLLAEADIPYDRLIEMDDINGDFPQTDVALVIGANDVTNPAARTDTGSPIYGMPILDVDKARTVMVIKRSMSPGFAGIDNPLYYLDKTLMLFGDAKAFVNSIVHELTASPH